MDYWYEIHKKHLDEIHEMVQNGYKSNRKMDAILLAMIIVAVLCFGAMAVLNFCKGDWYIVFGIWYILMSILDGWLGVEAMRRMKNTKEKIKANDLWYESELNRLNNLIKESESNECGED